VIIQGGPVLCKCGENAARYMNERGELCCSLCPLKEGVDSIKLDDVPKLLAWARSAQVRGIDVAHMDALNDIVQRRPVQR
jgi:hypothetical protein